MTQMQEIDIRKPEDLQGAVATADMILGKTYLASLSAAQVVRQKPVVAENAAFLTELNNKVRFFDVTQIVLNKNENTRDKLVSVFNAVGSAGAGLLMLVRGDEARVSIQFGVKDCGAGAHTVAQCGAILQNSLKGNFPGTKIEPVRKESLQSAILSAFPPSCSVAAVTDVSGVRSDEETRERLFMQGMEKLIDTMQGRRYTLLLIADPVGLADLNASRRALENLYSSLVPFSESQLTMGANESESVSNAISRGTTETVTQSLTESVSHTSGTSTSTTDGTTNGGSAGAFIGVPTPFGMAGANVGGSHSKTHSFTEGQSQSDTTGSAKQVGSSSATSVNTTQGEQHGTGTSQSVQIRFENHAVKQLMQRIDKMLARYDTCADVGMWNCAMYCIAENAYDAQMAASVYHSVVRGKHSSLENGGVTVWDADKTPLIVNSLKYMAHPFLRVGSLDITPGALISSAELAIHAGLPCHSVPGLPVLECAEFGRTVASYDAAGSARSMDGKTYAAHLGTIWHMNQPEALPVQLDPDSLALHTFVTGSTGAGKSNTVYQLLSECAKLGVHFLVVEPAKGEYKNVFGTQAGVSVYSTNSELSPLLRINPFSFPHGTADAARNIHILEHLDRLVELFNVCWPMYAAMPAVLKAAVEKSYEDCGWNLAESTNAYGSDLYPTFADVARNVRAIIDSSDYDAENKGAYKGSLITRLTSLTNGINGQVFTADEIAGADLFDKNVIVDLSRVGSSETKSLIMGLLVLKLQEHRLASTVMNAPLRHITVLEEAHNLLKRTSTEQSAESANLLGKSVEMLTNAIAEMRTYGEGFVIADQAPALLDMAVIRNTNTKIIHRLPDKDDRELVGSAANLNDDQIAELAKLPRGVAAVYQNEWVQAVLCKVEHFADSGKRYLYTRPALPTAEATLARRIRLTKLLCSTAPESVALDDLQDRSLQLGGSLYVAARRYAASSCQKPDFARLSPIVSALLPEFAKTMQDSYMQQPAAVNAWRHDVQAHIEQVLCSVNMQADTALRNNVLQCILQHYILTVLQKPQLLQDLQPRAV